MNYRYKKSGECVEAEFRGRNFFLRFCRREGGEDMTQSRAGLVPSRLPEPLPLFINSALFDAAQFLVKDAINFLSIDDSLVDKMLLTESTKVPRDQIQISISVAYVYLIMQYNDLCHSYPNWSRSPIFLDTHFPHVSICQTDL